jgi:hypothetical protein
MEGLPLGLALRLEAIQQCDRPHGPVTQDEYGLMCALAALGRCPHAIAVLIRRDEKTVKRQIWPLFHPEREIGPSPETPLGKAQVTSMCTKLLIRHFSLFTVWSHPQITTRGIELRILEETYLPFSLHRSRIGVIINELRIKWAKSIKRPYLTTAQKEYRVKFATEILQTMLILLPWLFTDESMVDLNHVRKGLSYS